MQLESLPIRSSFPAVGLIVAVSTILLGMVLFIHYSQDVMIGDLTRDPVAIWKLPFYTGFLSLIGLLFWSASAAVCFLSVRVLSRRVDLAQLRRFLFASGLLATVLGLDDAFQLHEGVLPYLGIPEEITIGCYGVFVLFYCIRFYPVILETEYVLLLTAFIFFGFSVLLDLLHLQSIDPYLFEDGAKLIGIVSWLVYFFREGERSVGLMAANESAA